MVDVSELIDLGHRAGEEKWYVGARPFAAAGELQLWNIFEPGYSADQVVAIALVDERRGRGTMVLSKDIPALSDLLRGIVERNNLL